MSNLLEPRHRACASGCVFPIIDFSSGLDTTFVCGQDGHSAQACLLQGAESSTPGETPGGGE